MAECIAFDPEVKVKGAAVLATMKGITAEHLQPLIERHGLGSVRPEGWYPQQAWLDVLRDVAEGKAGGSLDLVSVGMEVPNTADWPPGVDSIEAALESIDVAYHMNHRNGEIGYYRAVRVGSHQIDVVCETPYPCDFDYGIVYGVASRFHPTGTTFIVRHAEGQCRKKGDRACVYQVIWEEM
ncbi:MAG TPA: hypothetical protein ENI95_04715 [Chloroflexi bacterium]|nr:hypothetical protein [Chloroflexota bacterium]